ncbi:MAG: hypothetical protein LKG38_03490 [Atopobiaceae bacterium]|jgi:peptidoglycan hydrolase CwlO-like protein|nr:hypothetical protein [Atopobiaceae bacterium]MCH4119425.1 hypothetical protein [Atopobiaceae bacterium]MCI1318390.1 hypothetical protein [Atopobiaceae bacterium]MCI1389012.1 hypothetical protein [Atopobiaceae bacterium]MCI1431754.1 hypothetical protein [Atopobiaceae bacterium]
MTNHARLVRIFALCCGVAVACCCVLFGAAPALAEDSSLDELQQKVQETSEAYESAKSELEDVQAKIDENEQRIAELEAQIPDQRKKAADAISATYKMQQGGSSLITLLLSAEDFNEFVTTMSYLNVISSKNADALTELVSMQDELESTKAELQKERESAEDKLAEAQKAMQEATAARETAQAAADEQEKQDQEAAQAAIQQAQAAGQNTSTGTTSSGNTFEVETPTDGGTSNVDWSDGEQEFVSSWGARIDAYLAGSPLAGHGATFAQAAWDYGVDPRWSPAIACIESSKGLYCFLPHNAWGWGNSSWPDWDTAIRAHVAGLASGYGYTISYEAAKRYCPPNAAFWYSSVLAQMQRI